MQPIDRECSHSQATSDKQFMKFFSQSLFLIGWRACVFLRLPHIALVEAVCKSVSSHQSANTAVSFTYWRGTVYRKVLKQKFLNSFLTEHFVMT